MANKQSKKTKFNINFETNIEALKKANAELGKILENNSLISRQGNTLKGAYKSSGDLLKKLTDLQDTNGTVTLTELKKMEREYDKIISMVNSLKEAESISYKQKTTQLNQLHQQRIDQIDDLKNVRTNIKNITAEIDKAKKAMDDLDDEDTLKSAVAARGSLSASQVDMLMNSSMKDITALAKTKPTKKMDAGQQQQIADANEIVQLVKAEKKAREDVYNTQIQLLEAEKKRKIEIKQDVKDTRSQYYDTQAALQESKQSTDALKQFEKDIKASKERTSKQVEILTKNKQREAEVNNKLNETTKKLVTTGIAYRMMMSAVRKIINDSIRAIIDMDKALTDMSVVTGQSRKELYDMIPALNELGQAAGATATEMAGLTAEYMKQGRTIKDSMELAKQTAKAAKISGISVTDSVEYMTSAINGFNLAARDAEHVSDVFAKVAAATATDYRDLAVALSKVSAQANTAGLSLEFTTALLAKGIETTQEAPESIGTALKTVIARMRELTDYGTVLEDDTSINKVERALDAAGVSLRTVTGEFRDLEEVFRELGPKWDQLNTMQQQAIAQAVAGTRQQSRFLAIMQDWDRTLAISATTLDAAGASAYQFSQYSKGLEYSITNLQTAWQGFVQTFTDTTLIKGGLDTISGFLNLVNDFMNLGDGLVGNLTSIGIIVTALVVGWKKLVLEQKKSALELINQTMATQACSEEEAIRILNEKKMLNFLQKQTLEKEKQLALDKKANKEVKISNKTFKELLALNEKDKKFTDGRTKGAKELAKYAKLNKLTNEQEVAIANALNTAKTTTLALENAETVTKLRNNGLNADEVKDEITIAATKGVSLSVDQAIAIAKARKNKTLNEELLKEIGITSQESIQLLLEKAENKEKKKGLGLLIRQRIETVKDTIAEAWKAFYAVVGTAGVVGIGIGAALLALAGITAAVSASQQKSITDNQDTIYENKEKTTNLKALRDEYSDILEKKANGMATSEELDRLGKIEEELQEIDKDLVGTGQTLIDTIDEKIGKLDDETAKLIEENKNTVINKATKTNGWDVLAQIGGWVAGSAVTAMLPFLAPYTLAGTAAATAAIADAVNKKQVKNNLTKEENQLAIRQAASYSLQAANKDLLNDREGVEQLNEAVAQLDAMYARIDWEEFAENNYKNLEQSLNTMEKQFSNAAMDIAKSDTLSGDIKAYTKNLKELEQAFGDTNPQLIELYQTTYSQYANLADYVGSIETLELSGKMTGDQILNLVARLSNLDVTSEAVGKTLDELVKSEGGLEVASQKMVEEMLGHKYDTSAAGLQYWVKTTGVSLDKLQEMIDKGTFSAWVDNIITEYSKLSTNGITADNVKEYRDSISSKHENVAKARDAILEGNLTAENIDYLEEHFGDLYASAKFQDALKNNSTLAAQMLTEALTANIEDTISSTQVALEQAQDKLATDLKHYGLSSYDELLSLSDAQLQNKYQDDWQKVKSSITSTAIEVQRLTDSLESMKNDGLDVEKLDAYTVAMEALETTIADAQEKLDKLGHSSLQYYQEMATAYATQKSLVSSKLASTLETMAVEMGMTTQELQTYYKVVNGKIIPDTEKLNKLNPLYLRAWQNNVDTIEEFYEKLDDIKDSQEELLKTTMQSVADMQQEYIDSYSEFLTKQNEETLKNLDERQSYYEKYFNNLDAMQEEQDFEADRSSLINKIAALSTATDSASLSKLKEAQQALSDLNKEQATAQRERRREAVLENLEEQRAEVEKSLADKLEKANELWAEILNKMNKGDTTITRKFIQDLLYSNYDNMTDAQKYLADQDIDSRLESIGSYGYNMSDYNSSSIADKVSNVSPAVSPVITTQNGDTTVNNSSFAATLGDIYINGERASADIQQDVSNAVYEAFAEIAKQFGFNISLSGGA